MPSQQYRLYCLSRGGGISLADWIEAESDEQAIERARLIQHGARKIEIWQRDRLVAAMEGEVLAGSSRASNGDAGQPLGA